MGKQWKQCETLFLGGSKITADGGFSHEIKRHLLLGRKVMTNLAAKSPQSCPTLCDSIDGSRPGSPIPGILQARTTRVGYPYMTIGKTIALTRWTFVGKVMSLFFNMLSRLVWRSQWHPTPVLLTGKSHGWRSLEGCSPWGC